jgi:hypothetical protein
LELAHT